MKKLIAVLSLTLPVSTCLGKNESNKSNIIKPPLCSSVSAKKAVIKHLDKIYGKHYLNHPIYVRSDNKLWDICAKRSPLPKKIVHTKISKYSKNCEIISTVHYDDAVVVNTGNYKDFLTMKKQFECHSEQQLKVIKKAHLPSLFRTKAKKSHRK